MSEFNVSTCPVCSNSTFSPFLNCTDYFVSNEQFSIKQCNNCGFKITENIADEENIGKYYQSENYISHSNTNKGIVNVIYHRVRNYMLGQKRKIVEKATQTKKGALLDVGTGTGYFLQEMAKNGWQTIGVEKSDDARFFTQNEFGLQTLAPEKMFDLQAESFDAITLWHVLEHIHQLDKNLKTFANLLKENGRLIIAVPNHNSYDAKHYKQFWAAYDVPRHIWHFSPKQMKLFGEKHGFELLKMHPMPFDSFYVSMLSEKYKKSKLAFLSGILHGKISWLASLLNTAKCSSVVYVFKKIGA